jgi:ketosteroid isomerase-like protein
MDNAATLRAIYEAFGRGDMPAILALISDEARFEDWPDNSAVVSGKAPYMLRREGKAGAAAFFGSLAALEIHDFRVLNILAGGDQACASVAIDFTVKATGKRVRDEELHLWTFGADGRVVAMRHYSDTAKHIAANS